MPWFKERDKTLQEKSGDFMEYGNLQFTSHGLYSDNHIYYDYPNREVKKLPDYLSSVAVYLQNWSTLNDQVEFLKEETGLDEDNLQTLLSELIESGILISKPDFLGKIRKPDETEPAGISSFVCCTRNRPFELERCIKSFLNNMEIFGRKPPQIIIFDDSEKPGLQGINSLLPGQLASEITSTIIHIGEKEKADFTANICKKIKDLPDEVISFALNGNYGAGRNLSLLYTAGECIISADDDTECLFGSPSVESNCLMEICSDYDPVVYKLFKNRSEIRETGLVKPLDIIKMHEGFLGRDIASIASEVTSENILLKNCSPELTASLIRQEGRAAITSAGITGDCAMRFARTCLTYKGISRDALTGSPGYSKNRFNRNLHRLAPHLTLTRGDFFMAPHCGIDNREIIPPFFPVYRNEDGLFGATLTGLSSDAFICHLPASVFHNPMINRSYNENSLRTWKPNISEIMILLVKSFTPPPGPCDIRARMRGLGAHLIALSRLHSEDFVRFVVKNMLPSITLYMETLSSLLDEYNSEPAEWAEDVEAMIAYIEKNISDPEFFVPIELSGSDNVASTRCLLNLIRLYGELLEWWPEIWDTAKKFHI